MQSFCLAVIAIIEFFAALWWAAALHYQLPFNGPLKLAAVALWLGFAIAMIVVGLHGRPWTGSLIYIAAVLALLAWWRTILPSNDRLWADDVAQMTQGVVDGNIVTLHNVRNFDWRTATDYTQRWETRRYDLDRLASVDLVTSHWFSPAIAHTLVSFGFDNGDFVVFSVEIRKEKTESFSSVGGFFKEFETSVVASDERDILRVRTNIRKEDDYLYRVEMPKATMRSLFLSYVDEANRLIDHPRFYNTVTANCTTIVYHMMDRIVPGLPLDYRLLLSGYLPSYVYDQGALAKGYSFNELRERAAFSARAIQADADPAFSVAIRKGVPGIDPAQVRQLNPAGKIPQQ
jgi:hypothetical protein